VGFIPDYFLHQIRRAPVGFSKLWFTNRALVEDSSVTETPSNVSPLVHGAELRVAETRAVNRALRKAYGIGICSVEELGSVAEPAASPGQAKKLPPRPANGNGFGGPKVRDRLCQIIRQHQLDPTLVKSYATDFCGVKTLCEASREQIENFVDHLADRAEKDRNALLCPLNSYLDQKEGAA
jgi:hypothetical protein